MSDSEHLFPLTSAEVSTLDVFEELPSTNAWQKDNSSELVDWATTVTLSQTAGRGRLGRSWLSSPGGSLAFSAIFPACGGPHRSWLALVAGAAVAEAIRALGVGLVMLKWPNDVLIDAKKISGTLCEALGDNRVVVGIGVNLDMSSDNPVVPGATGLNTYLDEIVGASDSLMVSVIKRLKQWNAVPADDAAEWARGYVEPLMGTLGSPVSVHHNLDTFWTGQALGLDDDGHLLVRDDAEQSIRTVVASDILHLRQ